MSEGGRPEAKLAADAPEVTARVKEGLPFLRVVALKLRRRFGGSMDLEELQSMGSEGLLDAARSYRPELGVPFKAWAYLRIRGSILDALRRHSGLPRGVYREVRAFEAANEARKGQVEDEAAAAGETAESADARIAQTTSSIAVAMAMQFLAAKKGAPTEAADRSASPEEQVIRSTLLEKIREAIASLPDSESKLMTAVYFDDATIEEAGAKLGLSKSWSSRLHARALEKLAAEVREKTLENEPREE